MSTTSTIPQPWADGPWPILRSPQGEGQDIKSHYAVYMATEMCHVHNMFIRAMNSIYLQSPHVKNIEDIADLLFYTKTVVITIEAHHDGEEKYLFPGLAAYTQNPDIMKINQVQHAAFHDGMQALGKYCTNTSPSEYSHATFKAIIESFADSLFQHLSEEIPTILDLRKYPSEGLKSIWAQAEKHIDDVGSFDEMFPLAFGCMDRGFEAGQFKFPPAPAFVNYVVKYWFARKHRGAWRFNPSDMWGNPRPLFFLSKK